jgi:hypothetical protein
VVASFQAPLFHLSSNAFTVIIIVVVVVVVVVAIVVVVVVVIIIIIIIIIIIKSRDRAVGIALGYGLDDRSSRVLFPAEAGNFSHHRAQNSSGANPASYPIGTRRFPWG